MKVEPDRPDVSNSTHTVPVRALQVELGLAYARSHNDTTERRLALQTTLRTGLTDRLEVRLDSEPLVRLKEDSDDVGLGDIALRVDGSGRLPGVMDQRLGCLRGLERH